MRCRWAFFFLVLIAAMSATAVRSSPPSSNGPQVPVGLGWHADGLLRVALRDARQVASIDPKTWKVTARHDLPFRPISIASSHDLATLYVGGMDGEVLALRSDSETLIRKATGKGPARVLSLSKGRIAVATTWDRSVCILDGKGETSIRSLPLGFSPGAMILRPDGRIIVADAFGGKLAEIDPNSDKVRTRTIDGVNLRALAISGDGKELLIGHMTQYGPVPVTGTNIDWGLVLSSRLSAVPLDEFEADDRDGEALTRRRLTLDGSGHGAADPSAMVVSRGGDLVLISLAGSHQILKNDRTLDQKTAAPGRLPLGNYQRLEVKDVGQSPMDLVLDPTGEFVISADAMSDTLSVLQVDDLSRVSTVLLGANESPPSRTEAQRGEAHFLDGRRSLDRWMSCSSCHHAGHTNGLNFDTLGDGSYGAAKNTPSLLGVGPTAPFSWTGRFETLDAQVHQSLVSSLRGPTPGNEVVMEISAYLRSLAPPPPRQPDELNARRGAEVFVDRRCDRCHLEPTYTSAGIKYIALDDGAGGHNAFNTPSLRGVGWSAPYLHDGRASSLDEVFDLHPPGLSTPLTSAERRSLKAFLESL